MGKWLSLLVVLIIGCSTETPDSDAELTYYEDVRPMLDTYCTRCHMDGGTGPVDFQDPDNALALAEIMLAQIDAGLMPPPVSDPDCRDYVDSERMSLPPEARETLAAWIEQGKALGDPANAVEVEPVATQLENPDLFIQIPQGLQALF